MGPKFLKALICALSLGSVTAAPVASTVSNNDIYGLTKSIVPPGPSQKNAIPCLNTPYSRQCWNNYNISSNYYQDWPNTGVVRTYVFSVSSVVASPDGYSKPMMLINGQYPAPTITADWGDTIRVILTNNLPNNGTSLHFHGLRQYQTNEMDGANGVTECPLAPGQSKVYNFLATQYGTSWYHSHFSVQLGEGVVGPIVINGPASANYDVDVGPVSITDNYHHTAFSLFEFAQTQGPPLSENGLINGMNVYNCTGSKDVNCKGTGQRWSTSVIPGLKYRLRLINTSVDTMFKIQIDNHTMTVIQNDFVPIKPYQTNTLFLAIGQRYDVIITANQPLGNYWLRAIAQNSCSNNANPDNIRGIIRYIGQLPAAFLATPALTPSVYTDSCQDELLSNLVPVVAVNPTQNGNPSFVSSEKELPIGLQFNNGVFKWTLNSNPIVVNWQNPTLLQTINGNTSASNYPTQNNVIELKQANQWVYFVIDSQIPVAHPIHLHGHDFSILAQGVGTFSATSTPLNYNNPPRRDVALMPGGGFLVIGFITDNPGSWLMHCHIAWHVAEGLSVQFLERAPEQQAWVGGGVNSYMGQTCKPWNQYINSQKNYIMEDSGL